MMRAVIQRVNWAKVLTDNETLGEIKTGLLVFLGAGKDDNERDISYLAEKTAGLRVFEDNEGKMNLSLMDVSGEALVVSQFTLFGDCRKGKRPSFTAALEPEKANEYYLEFVKLLKNYGIKVATGRFQADMDVRSSNDGPVTILIDSKKIF